MSDDKKKNLKVIEFPKQQDENEQTPQYIIDALESALKQAKDGKLVNFVMHFTYEENEGQRPDSSTIFWNDMYNPVEMLGLLELLKSIALDMVSAEVYEED